MSTTSFKNHLTSLTLAFWLQTTQNWNFLCYISFLIITGNKKMTGSPPKSRACALILLLCRLRLLRTCERRLHLRLRRTCERTLKNHNLCMFGICHRKRCFFLRDLQQSAASRLLVALNTTEETRKPKGHFNRLF